MKSTIYRITNIINFRIYIGSSIHVETRWKEHLNDLRKNKHPNYYLQKDFNLYGEDKFIFSIVEECNKDELQKKEQFYLDKWQPFHKNYGYNIRKDVTFNEPNKKRIYRANVLITLKLCGLKYNFSSQKHFAE